MTSLPPLSLPESLGVLDHRDHLREQRVTGLLQGQGLPTHPNEVRALAQGLVAPPHAKGTSSACPSVTPRQAFVSPISQPEVARSSSRRPPSGDSLGRGVALIVMFLSLTGTVALSTVAYFTGHFLLVALMWSGFTAMALCLLPEFREGGGHETAVHVLPAASLSPKGEPRAARTWESGWRPRR